MIHGLTAGSLFLAGTAVTVAHAPFDYAGLASLIAAVSSLIATLAGIYLMFQRRHSRDLEDQIVEQWLQTKLTETEHPVERRKK